MAGEKRERKEEDEGKRNGEKGRRRNEKRG